MRYGSCCAGSFSRCVSSLSILGLPESPKSGMKMAVECIGSYITICPNGQQVARVKDDESGQGYVGFILSGMGSANFSDLVVAPQ